MTQRASSSVKKRVAVSTAAQLLGQIITAVLGVVILKMMTRHLGVQNYGIYATALAFVTTFSLLTDLGLNAITAREIAKRPNEANEIIGFNMGLRLALCLMMVPIISIIGFTIYADQPPTLKIAIFLLSFYLFFDAVRSVAMAYFSAKIRNDVTAVVNTSQQVFMMLLVVIGVLISWGVYGFIFAFVAGNVLAAILAIVVARKHVKIRPRVNVAQWKAILGLSLSIGVLQIVNMLYLKADTILISTLKGPAEAGIYGVAYSLILAVMTLPSFIMSALIPAMATAKDDITPIIEKAYHYIMIMACLLVAGAFLVRKDVIFAISSASFASAATPFVILALASAFSYVNAVVGFASVALNKHSRLIYVAIGSLILNVSLNIILIPKYSINGAAIATVISEFFGLIAAYIIFTRQTGIRISRLADTIKAISAALITVLCVGLLYDEITSTNHLLNLAIIAILAIVFYAIILIVFRGIPSEFYKLPVVRKILRK